MSSIYALNKIRSFFLKNSFLVFSMSAEAPPIAKWLEAREKLDEYTKRVEKYRNQIEEYMVENHLNEIPSSHPQTGARLTIQLSSQSRESLSKKDVPTEVWERYCKATRFRTLRVKQVKGD